MKWSFETKLKYLRAAADSYVMDVEPTKSAKSNKDLVKNTRKSSAESKISNTKHQRLKNEQEQSEIKLILGEGLTHVVPKEFFSQRLLDMATAMKPSLPGKITMTTQDSCYTHLYEFYQRFIDPEITHRKSLDMDCTLQLASALPKVRFNQMIKSAHDIDFMLQDIMTLLNGYMETTPLREQSERSRSDPFDDASLKQKDHLERVLVQVVVDKTKDEDYQQDKNAKTHKVFELYKDKSNDYKWKKYSTILNSTWADLQECCCHDKLFSVKHDDSIAVITDPYSFIRDTNDRV